jgi:hypothetical protein
MQLLLNLWSLSPRPNYFGAENISVLASLLISESLIAVGRPVGRQGRSVLCTASGCPSVISFCICKGIYFTDSIYRVYKDKLQNCSCNQFE